MTAEDNDLRRSLRQMLLSHGTPIAHVDEVVDLAMHASQSAAEAVLRILMSASDKRVTITAASLATGLIEARFKELGRDMSVAANLAGLKVMNVTVGGSNG